MRDKKSAVSHLKFTDDEFKTIRDEIVQKVDEVGRSVLIQKYDQSTFNKFYDVCAKLKTIDFEPYFENSTPKEQLQIAIFYMSHVLRPARMVSKDDSMDREAWDVCHSFIPDQDRYDSRHYMPERTLSSWIRVERQSNYIETGIENMFFNDEMKSMAQWNEMKSTRAFAKSLEVKLSAKDELALSVGETGLTKTASKQSKLKI